MAISKKKNPLLFLEGAGHVATELVMECKQTSGTDLLLGRWGRLSMVTTMACQLWEESALPRLQ